MEKVLEDAPVVALTVQLFQRGTQPLETWGITFDSRGAALLAEGAAARQLDIFDDHLVVVVSPQLVVLGLLKSYSCSPASVLILLRAAMRACARSLSLLGVRQPARPGGAGGLLIHVHVPGSGQHNHNHN